MFEKSNKSAFENFLLAKYEKLTGERLVRSYPYLMLLDPSSICGLQCVFCPTGSENLPEKNLTRGHYRTRTTMSVELFDSLMEELGEYLFMIMFYNWGEPLLNKHLPYFIKRANALGIYTEIHTNLSLRLTDQAMEELLLSGIDEIAVSIDGFSEETYSTYRRGGNFELVKGNIERLAATRGRLGLRTKIVWNFLVFSFNEHQVEDARRYSEEIGVVFNKRSAYIGRSRPEWLPSDRKGEFDKPRTEDGKTTGNTAPKRSCSWHYGVSLVNADGSVSPCCALWEQKHDFGTVLPGTASFADVWNNNFFRKARAVALSAEVKGVASIKPICENCPVENIKDQYARLEENIARRYSEVFLGSDPVLEKAFGLLSSNSSFAKYYSGNLLSRDKKLIDADRTESLRSALSRLKRKMKSVYASRGRGLDHPLRRLSGFIKGIKGHQ